MSAILALKAIASMDQNNWNAEHSAICTAIAQIELAKASGAEHPVVLEALNIIAGNQQCLDNLMGHSDVARQALASAQEKLP